MYRKT